MPKAKHPQDVEIITLLQHHGMIKSEANAYLKQEVYRLKSAEITKINNYTTHFSLQTKQQLIDEILTLRRETLLRALTQKPSQSNSEHPE